MAKVVRLHELGGPEVLCIDDIAVGAPAEHEVRIAVEAIGLNRVETMYRKGFFGTNTFPVKIGYEAAGVIDAVGANVKDFSVGDRVAVLPGLSMEQYGTYGESILYPASALVRIPYNQTTAEAAASWMQYLTAYALIDVGRINADDTVVIPAASSSVGLAAIQIANAVGATAIAVTRTRSKAEALLQAGAAHVIVSDEENVPQTVHKITQGVGATVIFDPVGGAQFGELLGALKPEGMIILYGNLAGDTTAFPASFFMHCGFSIHGYTANRVLEDPPRRAKALAFIEQGLASGRLRPIIDSAAFRLEDIVEAHRYLESNNQIGKIIVRVGPHAV